MSRVRLAAALGLIAVLAAALVAVLFRASQSSAERGPAAVTSPSPTPSASVEVASVPERDYPTPANTGEARSEEDLERIFREIAAFRRWLYSNPDPELVSLIHHPTCTCHDTLTSQLRNLQRTGLRYDDAGTQIHEIVLDARPTDYLALLRVVTSHGVQRIVDQDGNLVEEGAGWEPHTEVITLARGDDGRWRIARGTVVGPGGV